MKYKYWKEEGNRISRSGRIDRGEKRKRASKKTEKRSIKKRERRGEGEGVEGGREGGRRQAISQTGYDATAHNDDRRLRSVLVQKQASRSELMKR